MNDWTEAELEELIAAINKNKTMKSVALRDAAFKIKNRSYSACREMYFTLVEQGVIDENGNKLDNQTTSNMQKKEVKVIGQNYDYWTDDELAILETCFEEKKGVLAETSKMAAKELKGRNYDSCYGKLRRMIINGKLQYDHKVNVVSNLKSNSWSPQEDEILQRYQKAYKSTSDTKALLSAKISKHLPKRTAKAVGMRLYILSKKAKLTTPVKEVKEEIKEPVVLQNISTTNKIVRLLTTMAEDAKKYEEAKKTVETFEKKYTPILNLLD